MAPIRCAILGYGYMGEIRHRFLGDAFELVAICDTKERPAGLPQGCDWVTDPALLLADSSIEAVFVCVPNALIPGLTVEALNAGKHVFCEKPPGRMVTDIELMRKAETRAGGKVLMFGFNHRFHPAMQEAKRLIEAGELGTLCWLKGTYGKSGGNAFERSWRNDPSVSGGGILLDQGIHMIDLFRMYAGDFQKAKAFCGTNYWTEFSVEDNAFVILENEQGQHGLLHSSATLWRHTFRLEMGLTEGYLRIEGFLSKSGSYGRETLTVGRRQFEDVSRAAGIPEETVYAYDKDESWAMEAENFARCIESGMVPAECSSHDALRAMELVFAAYADSQSTS